jgi:hypothetical protein
MSTQSAPTSRSQLKTPRSKAVLRAMTKDPASVDRAQRRWTALLSPAGEAAALLARGPERAGGKHRLARADEAAWRISLPEGRWGAPGYGFQA